MNCTLSTWQVNDVIFFWTLFLFYYRKSCSWYTRCGHRCLRSSSTSLSSQWSGECREISSCLVSVYVEHLIWIFICLSFLNGICYGISVSVCYSCHSHYHNTSISKKLPLFFMKLRKIGFFLRSFFLILTIYGFYVFKLWHFRGCWQLYNSSIFMSVIKSYYSNWSV